LFCATAAEMGDEEEQTGLRIELRRIGHWTDRASIGAI
jgi:hypothetical protein